MIMKKRGNLKIITMQFNGIAMVLLLLIALGIFSQNRAITLSSIVLLLVQQTFLMKYVSILEKYAIEVGITILTIGVLTPLVSGKIQITNLKPFLNWQMLTAIGIGILVAWLGGRGVSLMQNFPTLLPGLIIGTIIGVAVLGGVPVGPLIAAGILSLVIGNQLP